MLSSILQYLLHSTEAYLGLIRTSTMECFFTKNVVVRLGSQHVSEVMDSTCYKVMVSIEMNWGIDKNLVNVASNKSQKFYFLFCV